MRETNTQTSQGNSLQTLTNNPRKNDGLGVTVAKPSKIKSPGDVYTPQLAEGTGKIPESKLVHLEPVYVHDCQNHNCNHYHHDVR